jgi:DNA-binding IscR family transcriptional regulator
MTNKPAVSLLNVRGRVLLILAIHGHKTTQSEIANIAGVHFQHVNRALKELTKSGILKRKRVGRRSFYTLAKPLSECGLPDAELIAQVAGLDIVGGSN